MSKTIPNITDLEIEPFYAVELYFDDSNGVAYGESGYLDDRTVRLWTGYYERTLLGKTFTGAGTLLNIPNVEEVADMSARSAEISLSGSSPSLVSLALQEPYQGRQARILFGINNETPVEIFGGLMDVMTIQDSNEAAVISLTVESRLVELERVRPFRYTDQSHKLRHPNDDFFSFVPALQDKEIIWGRSSGSSGSPATAPSTAPARDESSFGP